MIERLKQWYVWNWWTAAWLFLMLSLGGAFVLLKHNTNVDTVAMKVESHFLHQKQTVIQSTLRKNKRVIYLPDNNALHLTSDQKAAVVQLRKVFLGMTSYPDFATYQQGYQRYQKTFASVKDLQTGFSQPSAVATYRLKAVNLKTQVLITGKDQYQVVVIYVLYHDDSDLYNPQDMMAQTKIINVSGTVGHFKECQLDKTLNVNAFPISYDAFS